MSGIAASEAIHQELERMDTKELERMDTMDGTTGLTGDGSGGGEDADSIGENEEVHKEDP